MQDENKKSFRQGMKAELKKVIWPTGKQVVKSTFATIGFVLLISIILIVLNSIFSFLNAKWFELVIPGNESQQNNQAVVGSGDTTSGDNVLEDVVISGDNQNAEVVPEEDDAVNTNVDSGDENIITE